MVVGVPVKIPVKLLCYLDLTGSQRTDLVEVVHQRLLSSAGFAVKVVVNDLLCSVKRLEISSHCSYAYLILTYPPLFCIPLLFMQFAVYEYASCQTIC